MEGSESEKVFDSLNLNPQLFINEVLNSVDDLTEDAFDFFHQEASNLLKTEGTDRSEDLKKGVDYIRNMIQLTLDKRLSMWEKYCLRHVFSVPEGFSFPKTDVPTPDASLNFDCLGDLELDTKLNSLRDKLSQVGKESAELNRELQTLERQSMLSNRSAASLTEALELYKQESVNEKFEELVQCAAQFHTKVENLKSRRAENTECLGVNKIRTSNGDTFGLNSSDGLFSETLEELHEFLDVMKTL